MARKLKMNVRITGVKKLQRSLRRLGKKGPQFMARALYEEAEMIMTASKRIVPVEFGALRSSGHVQPPKSKGRLGTVVSLVYGGASAPYALFVHENLRARHKSPTQAKYLSIPFNAAQRGMLGRLARKVRLEIIRQARASA